MLVALVVSVVVIPLYRRMASRIFATSVVAAE